jgi:ribosomal protein S15P/S13E
MDCYSVSSTKSTKITLKKSITKKQKKKHVKKHGSNPQCFVRKATVLSPHDLALLVKKITKLNYQPA